MTLSLEKYEQILKFLPTKSYRSIAETIGISPTTVCRTAIRYFKTGHLVPPKKRTSKYDPFEELISERVQSYLITSTTSFNKRSNGRPTVNVIYKRLLEEGYDVKLPKVKQIVRLEKNRLRDSFLDIYYTPGVMCQFDWGQKRIIVDDKPKTIYFAVFALPYSNYRKVYITENMNGHSFVQAFKNSVQR